MEFRNLKKNKKEKPVSLVKRVFSYGWLTPPILTLHHQTHPLPRLSAVAWKKE